MSLERRDLAAILERELGIEPELIRGDRGVFDVAVDGKLLLLPLTTMKRRGRPRTRQDGDSSR